MRLNQSKGSLPAGANLFSKVSVLLWISVFLCLLLSTSSEGNFVINRGWAFYNITLPTSPSGMQQNRHLHFFVRAETEERRSQFF